MPMLREFWKKCLQIWSFKLLSLANFCEYKVKLSHNVNKFECKRDNSYLTQTGIQIDIQLGANLGQSIYSFYTYNNLIRI